MGFSFESRVKVGIFALYSFLLFCFLCVVAAVVLFDNYYWWLFVALAIVDGVAIFLGAGAMVSIDRAFFFLAVISLSVLRGPLNVFALATEILLLIAALDFSLFLGRLDGTRVDVSVMINRLRTYAYTVLPAFLLTYALYSYLDYFSNLLTVISFPQVIVIFGISSGGVLIIVYLLAQRLLSIGKQSAEEA